MARIHVNHMCNVVTEEHSNAFRHGSVPPKPEITVPGFRMRLSILDARALASALTEAIEVAENGFSCALCRCTIPLGDNLVRDGMSVFCTEACRQEAHA